MEYQGYQVCLYQRDQIDAVVTLLRENLWGDRSGRPYFEWKYHDNPYTDRPLGVVAVRDGTVVGFRGCFASGWQVGRRGERTVILTPGDTVVDPRHRVKGLSVAMGRLMMEEFCSRSPVFLNMTAGKNSVPGYRRMGFVPLADKVIYKRRGILRDLDALLRAVLKTPRDSRNVPLGEGRISFGRFGDIRVSPEPLPERMAEIVSRSSTPAAKIAPFQDEDFFRWRYGNPVGKYAFYIHEDRGEGAGYVVVAVSPDGRAGDIVDFGEEREGPIAAILDHISSAGEFEQLEILSYSVDARLWDTLRRSGFKRWRGRLVNRVRGTWPLLVRPVRPDCSEEDWFLGGLDIRDAGNWILKEICADSA